jgi:hypothetical protein
VKADRACEGSYGVACKESNSNIEYIPSIACSVHAAFERPGDDLIGCPGGGGQRLNLDIWQRKRT